MNLISMDGVRGFIDRNGNAQLNLEDVSRGLGFTQNKNDVEYIRWETVSTYLISFGFSQQAGKEVFIPESIFYRLAMKAKNEVAEKFQAKVAEEILPSIRKTGQYNLDQPSYTIDDPIERAQRWIEEERSRRTLISVNRANEEQLAIQAPKVALYDTAMNAGNNFSMEKVAKTLGYGRNKLFEFLREQKVLRINNMPYQEYLDRGYFVVRQYSITHTTTGIENKTQTLVPPKGMAFIHKLLVEHGKIKKEA